ncbi:Membrane-bound alkaline phosphatase [Habropoda laboriosa]|uniref:alkaline phosphatase n=1 Tax=Habropoda laboriosa TaxID=597456 RepID=A0A0L7R013_9HYME|nr:Membrane-bound alkaline phosphatase [Habropoda laboriosa]
MTGHSTLLDFPSLSGLGAEDYPHIRGTNCERKVWYEAATQAIEARIRASAASSSVSGTTPPGGVARGVVLFVGDGMGMSTLTAARILSGQRHGNTGEEAQLAWDSFPAVALARLISVQSVFKDFIVNSIWANEIIPEALDSKPFTLKKKVTRGIRESDSQELQYVARCLRNLDVISSILGVSECPRLPQIPVNPGGLTGA